MSKKNHQVQIEVFSCAEWPEDVYTNEYGKHVSTDRHYIGSDVSEALIEVRSGKSICGRLEKEGFGGMRKAFPVRTWVEVHSEGPYIVEEKSSLTSIKKIKEFPDLKRAIQCCKAHHNKVMGNTRVVLKGTNLRVYPKNGDYEYVPQESSS